MKADDSFFLLLLNAAEGDLHLGLATCVDSPLLLTAQTWHAPSQGAELLVPALSDALARLGKKPGDISHVACVRGPGSFTGLRLVLATASGLARSVGARLAGLSYMELLATSAAEAVCAGNGRSRRVDSQEAPLIWVATHARRNLVHMQGFAVSESIRTASELSAIPESVRAVSELLVLSPEEGARYIAESKRPGLLLGSGHTRNRVAWEAACAEAGTQLRGLPAVFDAPSWGSMLRAALVLDDREYDTADIAPLYARPCDAEENLEHIAETLGLEPAAARKRLDSLLL